MTITRAIFTCLGVAFFAAPLLAQADDNPPWSQANQYYDPAEMAKVGKHVKKHSGSTPQRMIKIDRFELRSADGELGGLWEADAWYGGNINKLWFKSEGEYGFDESDLEDANIEVLWSRATSTFFDVQTGIKYDLEPKGRTHFAIGFKGLAPHWFEVDGAAYLSTKGDLTGKFEAEYDWFLSQKTVLQPRLEITASAQNIPELEIGSGLSDMELGVRLSYDLSRQFSPYVGVEWESKFGNTRRYAKNNGEDPDAIALLLGVRSWF